MAVRYNGFRRQRLLVFSAMFIGWSLYNFCHKIFAASMSDLIRHRDLDKTDLGAIASMFTIFLRYHDWSQLYFIEAADLTEAKTAACVSMYQAGAVVGIILIGYLSDLLIRQDGDRQYKHSRAPVIFLNSLLIIGVLHIYGNVVLPGVSKVLLSCLQFCAGGLIEGGTNLIGVAVMDCVTPELSSLSHAMSTFLAQFGAFFAGFPFGYIVKKLGWNYAFLMLESISVVNVLISSYLLIRNSTNTANKDRS